MSNFNYRAFGINFYSEVELPELVPHDGRPDVNIFLGKTVQIIPGKNHSKILKADDMEVLYEINNVARCHVIEGQRVIIEPHENVSKSTLRLLILTSVMGCIFYQRKLIPVHGGAVTESNRCIVLMGNSGAGKSTLTSAFLKEGYQFLSDDVAIISHHPLNGLEVEPGYPYRKLKSDSLQYFSYNVNELERIEHEEDKYLVPVKQFFSKQPAPLHAMIEIVPADVENASIEAIDGIKKLQIIFSNLYRSQFIKFFNLEEYYFSKLSEIASKVKILRITRPITSYTCEKQMQLIREQLQWI